MSAAFLMAVLMLSTKCLILLRVYDLCFQRPVPLTEIKVSPPKFDLAATNFPPLPGCVVSTQGEPVLETRMSDVVRGLYKDKARRATEAGIVCVFVLSFMCNVPVCFQTEQASKVATVSPGSGPEDPAAVPSPALAAAKPASQPLGPSVTGYDFGLLTVYRHV